MNNDTIYLDAAAATPLDPRVLEAMQPYVSERFFNASSAYKVARSVRADFEAARADIAHWLGAKSNEIIMTAGATESINLALHGVMAQHPEGTIAVAAIEHASVLSVAKQFDSTLIAVDEHGAVTDENLRRAIDDKTVLISIGLVNSEIGVRQAVRKVSQTVQSIREDRQHRGVVMPLYVHTDASQTAGIMDVHVSRLGVDLMTMAANKMHGPKQVGLLFAKHTVPLVPLVYGGGQERGLRSGTENVAGVVGFARALRLAQEEREQRMVHISGLRDMFERQLQDAIPELRTTALGAARAPHISHMTVPGIDAETLLFMLDEAGVMVATGAACAANKSTASHVLEAIGMTQQEIQGSIRCSFMHTITDAEVVRAADIMTNCLKKLLERR